jgi:hypothetical protein
MDALSSARSNKNLLHEIIINENDENATNNKIVVPGMDMNGWIVHERARLNQSSCLTDKYWFSPKTHRLFRSLIGVKRFLIILKSLNDDFDVDSNDDENVAWAIFQKNEKKLKSEKSKKRATKKSPSKSISTPSPTSSTARRSTRKKRKSVISNSVISNESEYLKLDSENKIGEKGVEEAKQIEIFENAIASAVTEYHDKHGHEDEHEHANTDPYSALSSKDNLSSAQCKGRSNGKEYSISASKLVPASSSNNRKRKIAEEKESSSLGLDSDTDEFQLPEVAESKSSSSSSISLTYDC